MDQKQLEDKVLQSPIMTWAKKHKFLSAILIIVITIVIANALDEDKENANTQTQTENNNQQVVAEIKEVKEKVWTSVFKTTANSDKQTEAFELQGGQQKVVYKTTGSQYSICMVYVMKEGQTLEANGGLPVVSIDGDQTDETMMRKSKGQYYLDLKTANGVCDIEIQELR